MISSREGKFAVLTFSSRNLRLLSQSKTQEVNQEPPKTIKNVQTLDLTKVNNLSASNPYIADTKGKYCLLFKYRQWWSGELPIKQESRY